MSGDGGVVDIATGAAVSKFAVLYRFAVASGGAMFGMEILVRP